MPMWQTNLDTAQDYESFLRLPLSIEGSWAWATQYPSEETNAMPMLSPMEIMEMYDDHGNREAAYCCERDVLPGIS